MRKVTSIRRHELARRVAKDAGITNAAAQTTIKIIYDILRETIGNQESFIIPGVGTIRGEIRPGKWCRDPRNGDPIFSEPRLVARLKSYYKEKGD